MSNILFDKSCFSVVVEHVRPYVYVVSPVDDYEGGTVYVWERFGVGDTVRVVGFPVGVSMFFMDAVGARIVRL
jgi:hypothetical protein